MSEKSAVIEKEILEAVEDGAEESVDTALPAQQPSPEESVRPAAGEQDDAAEPEPNPEPLETEPNTEGEAAETPVKDDRKSRTAKRIHKLLDEKRSAEIENEQLKAQLRQVLLGQQPPGQKPTGAQQPTPAGAVTQQAEDDSPEYWANLYNRETDEQKRLVYWQKYEHAREKRIEERAVQRVLQEQARAKQAELVTNELTELNSVSPIFKMENGQPTLDWDSPLLKLAQAEAAKRGQMISDYPTLLYFGQKAALQLLQAGGAQAVAKAKQAQTRLTTQMAKTGLESAARSTVPAPKSPQLQLQKLQKAAEQGDENARRELTRLQLRAVLNG